MIDVGLTSATVGFAPDRPATSTTIEEAGPRLPMPVSWVALPLAFAAALSTVPGVIHVTAADSTAIYERDNSTYNASSSRARSIRDLGWTTERAAAMRHKLAAFADDWSDPAMDAYDDL